MHLAPVIWLSGGWGEDDALFRIGRKLEEIAQNAKKGCSKYEKLPKSCRATCGKPQERASSVKT